MSRRVDAGVVHPWGRYLLRRPGRGDHGAGPMVAVTDHQVSAGLAGLDRQLDYVRVDFGFQCRGEHPAGVLADNLIDQGPDWGEPSSVTTLSTGVPSRPALQRGPTR
ncbi:hypothetical protein GCM10022206_94980 [Streptomyces chiangmaiensis]